MRDATDTGLDPNGVEIPLVPVARRSSAEVRSRCPSLGLTINRFGVPSSDRPWWRGELGNRLKAKPRQLKSLRLRKRHRITSADPSENRRIGADAQSQREHDSNGEAGPAPEESYAVSQVLPNRFHQIPKPPHQAARDQRFWFRPSPTRATSHEPLAIGGGRPLRHRFHG